MVFVTTLLLIHRVLLNLFAIVIRNRCGRSAWLMNV
jgi:hypothetical protein